MPKKSIPPCPFENIQHYVHVVPSVSSIVDVEMQLKISRAIMKDPECKGGHFIISPQAELPKKGDRLAVLVETFSKPKQKGWLLYEFTEDPKVAPICLENDRAAWARPIDSVGINLPEEDAVDLKPLPLTTISL